MAPRSDPLRPAGHPQSTDSIQTQPGLLHPSQLSPSMHSVSSTPTPPADPPPPLYPPPIACVRMGLSPCAGTGQCVWVAGGGRAFSSVGNQEENRARDRTVQVNHYSSAPPGEGSCEDVAFSHPRAAWRKDTPRSAALPTLRCPPVPRGLDTGRGAVPPPPHRSPQPGAAPPGCPQTATIRVGPWKHSKAGHGGGGGWQRWDLTAAPGPSRKALPQEQRRRQGRDALLPTLHLAAGDVSHRQKCWVERKDAAPLTQLSRQPIPPARIAARRGWGGREAGCARALACCCRASLGAQHPVVLQGPTACTPYTAGKGLSPHLHGWTLQGCRSSGTAGCAEQLNHTSPC
ncbi:uncharacterized protein LOC121107749 isoform X1 [Gallus gallus]|uniref:uncharacterized protein LOC121107749 isoform X1 n=1 Tax=Gallus gallus TaxID=9031 RepID=UPI001AEA58DD|nr:uncharacterized protein LOC121107749 isoform X1 [Gallus gallus]